MGTVSGELQRHAPRSVIDRIDDGRRRIAGADDGSFGSWTAYVQRHERFHGDSELDANDHRHSADGLRVRDDIYCCDYFARPPAIAASRKPSNSGRNSPVRKKFSGCHWTPRQKRASGSSIASMTPSGAVADTLNPGATFFTA